MSASTKGTIFERLVAELKAKAETDAHQSIPAAILWPDKDCQFEALADRLRVSAAPFLTLGPYNKETLTGPGIYLRCLIARTLPEADWDAATVPVIYMPGYGRKDLTDVESSPAELTPLIELQYRGTIWSHENGKDWTIAGLLQASKGGLGLAGVASDEETIGALKRSLLQLADTPVESLRNKRIDTHFLNELLHPNLVSKVLQWLNSPDSARQEWSPDEWEAFRQLCKEKLEFDPELDGVLTAGEKLGNEEGRWNEVWKLYELAPTVYPGIKEVLRRSRPADAMDGLFSNLTNWPQDNERLEGELRSCLRSLTSMTEDQARNRIIHEEQVHGYRRETVWAKLGKVPLTFALKELHFIAQHSHLNLPGATPQQLADEYSGSGWEVDTAAIHALQQVRDGEDTKAVTAALKAIYVPWLERQAHRFQELITRQPPQTWKEGGDVPTPEPGVCFLFVDGLRFDIAHDLVAELQAKGLESKLDRQLAKLPTVTATCKPAVSPIAAELWQGTPDSGLNPTVREDSRPLETARFRKLLEKNGYPYFDANSEGNVAGSGWTEFGDFDKWGHDDSSRLPRHIKDGLTELAERIQSLFSVGWRQVKIVTDHGWLLVPGEMPKVDLPVYLTEFRGGRCAELKDTSRADLQDVRWYWNGDVRVATAPGIGSFYAGNQYGHGGVSLQECVIPTLLVSNPRPTRSRTKIESIKWVNLRCRVQMIEGAGCQIDIRTITEQAASSLLFDKQPKDITSDGSCAVVVPDESLGGTAAMVVVLKNGTVVARAPTEIPES